MKRFFRGEVRTPYAHIAAFAFTGLALLAARETSPQTFPYLPLLIFGVGVVASGVLGGQGPTLVATALSLLAVDYIFVPSGGTWKLPYTAGQVAAFAAFAATGVLTAWVSRRSRRITLATERADAVTSGVRAETHHRSALLELGARALAGGSVDAILHDATAMTRDALGVDHCLILESRRDAGPFVVAATAGSEAGSLEGLSLVADVDTQAGYALYAREPVIVRDADADARFSLPAALRARGVRSGIATRIPGTRRPHGVVAAYSTLPRTYRAEDAQFMTGVAVIIANTYERKRLEHEFADLAKREESNRSAADLATRRATFLAQTTTVFDTSLEPDATLVSLARLAVPALAECAVVDLVHEEGHVKRVEVVDIDPVRREVTATVRRQTLSLRAQDPFSRAIRTGQPALLSHVPDRDEPASTENGEHEPLMKALECQSLLLIPLVARGQTLGLLTIGSRERRYEAGDLALAQELAGRAAIALDNVRLYREAEAASRAKDDFLATISHELRTPINAVLGWAAMLRQHQLDPVRAEYACEAIERSARSQAQLLEQLLDVSRAVSGKLEMHLAPTHIIGIVEAAIDQVRPDAEERKVRIGSALDRSIPLLMVDPERLQQVAINLLSNAVKFSPENGVVQVELRRDDRAVELVVQDHGAGIKREFLPYVFDRFKQGGDGSGGAKRGLGLGMSIARDIVERHAGTISVESAGEGKGATFTVRLPLHANAEAPAILMANPQSATRHAARS